MYSAQTEHLISLMSGHHWMSAMWGEAAGGRDNTDIRNIVILHQHRNICTREMRDANTGYTNTYTCPILLEMIHSVIILEKIMIP